MPLSTFLDGRAPTRGLLWLALSDTAYVFKRSSESDGGGGSTDKYTKQAGVSARIDPIGGGEAELAARVSDRSTHVVTLRPGTEISLDDDLEIAGSRYEVTAIRSRTGEMALMVEVTDAT